MIAVIINPIAGGASSAVATDTSTWGLVRDARAPLIGRAAEMVALGYQRADEIGRTVLDAAPLLQ